MILYCVFNCLIVFSKRFSLKKMIKNVLIFNKNVFVQKLQLIIKVQKKIILISDESGEKE